MTEDYVPTSYWEMTEEQRQATGIDPDLSSALTHNPQSGWDLASVDRVLAVLEGDNDGPDWHWIIRLTDERFVYAYGGCDYTGWDCQSSLDSSFHATVEEALEATPETENWHPDRAVRSGLAQQIPYAKTVTWREQKAKEFGV